MLKQLLFVFLLAAFIVPGCSKNEEPVVLQESGVVLDYAGTDHCSIIIELDNGQRIQPLHYPAGFKFVHGQRVVVEYIKLPNIISTCGKGATCNILQIAEIDCGLPLTELGKHNYNSLPNDPVYLHEVFVDGDCLKMKISFSGGCTNHSFNLALIRDVPVDENTAVLELRHNANGDRCKALLTKDLSFSLELLKEEGFNQFYLSALLGNGETFTEIFELE